MNIKKALLNKSIMIAAALIFSITGVKAQGVHFGIKAGANFSELHGTDLVDMKTKFGPHAGVLMHIHMANPSWGVQPEVMYSLEGARTKVEGVGNVDWNLHFVNVPVLVQYMFANGWRVETGPQLGILAGAKVKGPDGESRDIKDEVNSINLSVPVGIGYLTRYGLGFDARYNFGISDLNKEDGGSKFTGNNFQFGLFYQFSDSKMK